ncbi:hypothetical protein SAMN03159341_108263 [Paenibacillus sp. 1_12]|uniref:anti-sigma factor family protein n=1 Tax=Paenibacillus sp. 1_12 TaxID=1566278 RepID=UPI0008E17F7F|nr:zf-HC2 domain-containing protein [Paenibacillus sp. 1_12]SFL69563.1 hypothetical protein SAMN03159341_108263 [Paenibacillus sp. 1_12]
MNSQHPNDRQLQRFLNRACSELEYKRIQQHIHICSGCRARLHTYLNLEEFLNNMDVLAPVSGLEDRVMQRIREESNEHFDERLSASSHTRKPKSAASRSRLWRSELINGLIATAATYLFISSGIMGKIISINAGDWGEGIQSTFMEIGNTVQQISLYLTS